MPFRITIEGEGGGSWLDDDLTLDESIAVEKDTETSWLFINPLRSASHCKAVLAAFLTRTLGRDEALVRVGKMNGKTALACVAHEEESDLPDEFEDGIPKAEDAPETT